MATEKTLQVLGDVATAIGDAEAQLPTARELIKIIQDANEDTTEVRALMADIDARIKQWTRAVERVGLTVEHPPATE